MNIKLRPEQEQWLQGQIAQGEFASVDDALQHVIADHMALEGDDFEWARPFVSEARAAVARGDVVSLDDAIADMDAHLASLKR